MEWNEFDRVMPDPNKWLLVTNNVNFLDDNGEMLYVWLTNFVLKNPDNPNEIICFDRALKMVRNLTHWKYANV